MNRTIDTKRRILDAAEKLFARYGYDRTSLRAITAAAGVNLAAVNYHFSSKEALVQAMLSEKIQPMNRRRLEMLDALEARAGGGAVPLPDVVRAFLEPVLELGQSPSARVTLALLGRMFYEPTPWAVRIFTEEVRDAAVRFRAALAQALPHLDSEELLWRFFFMIGTMAHTMAAGHILVALSAGRCDTADIDATVRRLSSFVIAGLSADGKAGSPRLRRKARN